MVGCDERWQWVLSWGQWGVLNWGWAATGSQCCKRSRLVWTKNTWWTAACWRTTCRGLMADAEALMSKHDWQSKSLKQLSSVHSSKSSGKKIKRTIIVTKRALFPTHYFCCTLHFADYQSKISLWNRPQGSYPVTDINICNLNHTVVDMNKYYRERAFIGC